MKIDFLLYNNIPTNGTQTTKSNFIERTWIKRAQKIKKKLNFKMSRFWMFGCFSVGLKFVDLVFWIRIFGIEDSNIKLLEMNLRKWKNHNSIYENLVV